MILAARHRSYSRLESSPVASGWSRSCSMMKRSIVTTDVSESTQRVHLKSDVARLVGTPDPDAVRPEPRHDLGGRMPVGVARADTDYRVARPQLVEPGVTRRRARAVMPDLEQRDRTHPALEPPFDRQPCVGLEEHPRPAVADHHDDAVLVHLDGLGQPRRVGTHDVDPQAVHDEAVSGARG